MQDLPFDGILGLFECLPVQLGQGMPDGHSKLQAV